MISEPASCLPGYAGSMRDGTASLTAQLVAAFRALAAAPSGGPLDPFADRLLPPGRAAMVRALRPTLRVPGVRSLYHLAGAGLPEHIELRTHHIDGLTRQAVAEGVRGVVLLGAGLDARAHRLPELAGLPVWEVDHPDTQRLKRGAIDREGVRYVAVDFTVDPLADRLREAGVGASGPLLWIWEGVTPYLPPEAIRASLDVVGALSPPGSVVVLTFALPSLITLPRWMHRWGRRGFRALGEPLLGLTEPEALMQQAREAGLSPGDHTGMAEWCAAAGRALPWLVVHERVLVARKV
jgi:methyltransferase (TIGR00027 family)